MLLKFLTNPYVLMVVCLVLVFGEMFIAKKWFTSFTSKIKNATVKSALNVVLGIVTSLALATAQMFALCDVLCAKFVWDMVVCAGLGATLLYVLLEKVFGNAKVNALGKAFCEFISHSDMFDGNITSEGVVAVAEKLLAITNEIDNKIASKEEKAIDVAVEKLKGFLSDSKITDEERLEAEKIIAEHSEVLADNSTYLHYQQLLNKK